MLVTRQKAPGRVCAGGSEISRRAGHFKTSGRWGTRKGNFKKKCAKMKVRSTLLQRQKRSDSKKTREKTALREDSGCGDERLG